jgi:hypothetical protein
VYESLLKYKQDKIRNRSNLRRSAQQCGIKTPLKLTRQEIKERLKVCEEKCDYFLKLGRRPRPLSVCFPFSCLRLHIFGRAYAVCWRRGVPELHSNTKCWWDSEFIGSFLALVAHNSHQDGNSHSDKIQTIHVLYPYGIVEETECRALGDGIEKVIGVMFEASHFAVVEVDVKKKVIKIIDGLDSVEDSGEVTVESERGEYNHNEVFKKTFEFLESSIESLLDEDCKRAKIYRIFSRQWNHIHEEIESVSKYFRLIGKEIRTQVLRTHFTGELVCLKSPPKILSPGFTWTQWEPSENPLHVDIFMNKKLPFANVLNAVLELQQNFLRVVYDHPSSYVYLKISVPQAYYDGNVSAALLQNASFMYSTHCFYCSFFFTSNSNFGRMKTMDNSIRLFFDGWPA